MKYYKLSYLLKLYFLKFSDVELSDSGITLHSDRTQLNVLHQLR